MKDQSGTTYQKLLEENTLLKQRIRELEQSGSAPEKARKALRKSDEYYKSIIHNSSDIIFVIDKLANITYASPSVERILGYRPDELTGTRTLDLIVSEDKSRAIADFGKALPAQEPVPNVFRLKHKDGTERTLEGIGKNLLDNPAVAGFVMNVRDITDSERINSDLQVEKAKLSNALEIAHLGHWEYDIDSDAFTFNDQFYKIFHTTAEQSGGYTMKSSEYADRFVHPDDKDIVGEETREAIETKDPYFNRQFEHRILYADGTVGYITVRFFIVKDSHGRTVKTYGVNQDITDRKYAEKQLRDTLESLRRAVGATIQAMVSTVEVRDPYTAGHQLRVADLARAIATDMGLSNERINCVRMAGSIHDIGKLSVPVEILSKPSKLSDLEFSLIKEHPRKGYDLLKDVESPGPLAEIVYQHHERVNGSGYPRGLRGKEILLEARILAVADVVETMASHRPYRAPLGLDAALEEIEKNKGTLYDADVADVCLRLFRGKGFKFKAN